jgi:enoyl-[acyl-carrier-protein] reductase (NADH)
MHREGAELAFTYQNDKLKGWQRQSPECAYRKENP